MAKTRAQRKAEQRRRQAEQARKGGEQLSDSQAQHDTQVPRTADEIEAELAERGADLDELRGAPQPDAETADVEDTAEPADRISRRARRRAERERSSAEAVAEPEVAPVPVEEADEPADKISRRARKQAERERRAAAKESERRRAPREEPVEKQRGAVTGFIASCWAELKRVQWPDRETLIQASAITLIFIAIMAAYLGVLDAVFNWLVKAIL